MSATPSRGLQLFDALLWLAVVTLALATVVIPLGLLTGRGDTVIDATVGRPFAVSFPEGRTLEVAEDGKVTRRNFTAAGEFQYLQAPPRVEVRAHVSRSDLDTRVGLTVVMLSTLAVVWTGLLNLRRIVRSARRADPFVTANVRRLRRVAGAVLVFPVVARIGAWFLDGTLDSDVDLRVASWGPGIWTCLLLGLGLLALAHVFRDGVALRELEQGTV